MSRPDRPRTPRHAATIVLIVLTAIGFLLSNGPEQPVLAAGDEVAATFRDGTLTVYVPNKVAGGANDVALELIDPTDKPIVPASRATRANRDRLVGNLSVGKVGIEDLAWARVKVNNGGATKIVSVSEILHLPVVRMFAQTNYAAGSQASVRIITLDSQSGEPLADSDLKIDLVDGDRATRVFAGRANKMGTAQADFLLPKSGFGARMLKVSAVTPLGPVEFAQPIQLVRRDRILLTTDKPMYQPSQTMHLRALSFDGPTRNAVANQSVTLEVEDAKGNKVFKQRGKTDQYGIASADFDLADEVNLGPYHVRAILGEGDAATTQEKTVTVDRYVLPKFKVEIALAGDVEKQTSSYFKPGDMVEGKVTARYLFGKPLSNAEVTLTLTTFDVESAELARITGRTNADGVFNFSSKLPDFLAGRSTEQGAAPVSISVDVKDTAEHIENKTRDILVSSTPILVLAVPESGQLLPGLDNRVFILTSYPDGKPARTTLAGPAIPAGLRTSDSGVATISVKATNAAMKLDVRATDEAGRFVNAAVQLEPKAQQQSLMLRTDRAVYKAGDTATLETMSTKQRGAVYIDVVRDGQTLVTRAIDATNGRAQLELDLTPEMFGTVEIRAYQITADADPISDRRLIFVDPADDLNVSVSADRESFKPGEEARLDFTVTDASGRPVSAALGVEIVDEAVFALSDKQPGFAKVFMYLQKELLTPRYEVHQFNFEQVILDDVGMPLPRKGVPEDGRQEKARVLLAAAVPVTDRDVRVEHGLEKFDEKRSEYLGMFQQRIFEQAQRVATGMTAWYAAHPASSAGFAADIAAYGKSSASVATSMVDPWSNSLVGDGNLNGANNGYLTILSLGPDGKAGTGDELNVQVYVQPTTSASVPTTAPFAGKTSVETGVIAGGRSSIEGTVRAEGGSPLGSIKVTARGVGNGRTLNVYSDARGRFAIPNLAPGRYHVVFEGVPYLTTVYKTFTLAAGARGDIDAQLTMRRSNPVALTAVQSYFEDDMVALDGAVRGAGGGIRRRDGAMRPMAQAREKNRMFKEANAELAAGAPAEPVATKTGVDKKDLDERGTTEEMDGGEGAGGPRVRSYFPETLYTNPALITDGRGHASIKVPLADSITTWRVSTLASTTRGALGSATAPVRVFQDFFIDLDLPVALTEGDAISVPVAVYNYLPNPQRVTLELRQDPWFSLDGDVASKQVDVGSGEVGVAYFKIKAAKIGEQQLQVTGRLDAASGSPGDAIARTVEVRPNGEERLVVVNERLEGAVTKDITFPANALPDASKIFVKFYPGALSQVVEGLDSILQMPGGCFEQTSSSTYPNVLVMDYLKTSKKITPEIQAKAEGFISLGYQRLVTFEVQGGGFSWFGEAPANKILTSYGLQEFYDMSKVHEVDPRLIERTQNWLAGQQKPDGSWEPDKNFINEGATNHYNTDVTRITAYIGWSLATTGFKGEAVEKARQYVASHVTGKEDAYTMAVIANFAVDSGRDKGWSDRMIDMLANKATDTGKTAFWKQEGETPTSAREDSADLESTALAAQALLKSGQKSALAKKALDYLTSNKDGFGNWQTTQATILSLKAFILSFTKGANADTAGTVEVTVDGAAVDRIEITRDNNDLLHQLDLKAYTHAGAHKIGLSFNGKGSMQYQIVGRYYVPWERPANPGEPLSIELAYDRTTLAQDEMATAKVKVRNNTRATAKMIMVDLGIPPGFEPQAEDFASLVDSTRGKNGGKLEKFTITAKQVILYFDGLAPNQTVEFAYKMRAKFPLRAQSFASRVYEYYNPKVEDKVTPAVLSVRAK